MWFKRKATIITLVSHHLCRQLCFPEELAVTSVPCLRAVSFPANQTASPSADPAASSGNSGSLSGHGCYCKLKWKTQRVRGPLLWPCEQKQHCIPSSQSRGRRGVCLPQRFRLLVEQNTPFSPLTQWLLSRHSHSAMCSLYIIIAWESNRNMWPAGPQWEVGWEWNSWRKHTSVIMS